MIPTTDAPRKGRVTNVSPIYLLKVTLTDIPPPIWRRLQVRGDISLYRLHEILQRAMPWENCHMHQFVVGETYYGSSDRAVGFEVLSDRSTSLRQVASSANRRMVYVYDMGDRWEHEIVVEEILPSDQKVRCAECVAGSRACPPDDCGGPWGYGNLLEAIKDPKHPEHADLVEWLGRPFDPEAFDLDAINRRLRRLR